MLWRKSCRKAPRVLLGVARAEEGENPSPGADTPSPARDRAGTNAPTMPDTCPGHVPRRAESEAPREQKAGRQRGGTRTLTQLRIKPPTRSGRRRCTSLQPLKPRVSGPSCRTGERGAPLEGGESARAGDWSTNCPSELLTSPQGQRGAGGGVRLSTYTSGSQQEDA